MSHRYRAGSGPGAVDEARDHQRRIGPVLEFEALAFGQHGRCRPHVQVLDHPTNSSVLTLAIRNGRDVT
ncbi:hypothetical protein, partial [Massilia phosphatilytica]